MADPPSTSRLDRGFAVAAAAAALACAGFLAWMLANVGGDRVTVWFDDLGELVAAVLAGAACLVAARRASGASRRAWALIAGWGLMWGLGEAVWSWYELVRSVPTPFPSLADAGFLGAIPFAVAGVLSFPAVSTRGRARLRLVLDGLTIASALLSVSWATVLATVYASPNDSMLAAVLSLAYPISDVAVGTMLLVLAMRTARGGQSTLVLLTCGLGLTAVADSGFAYLTANGTFGSGNWIDTGWVAGFLIVGLAGLRSLRHPVVPRPERGAPRSRLYLPYIPVAVALVLAVDEEFHGGNLGRFLFVTMLVLIVVVVARQVLTLSDNAELIRRLSDRERQLEYQASHDPLTDLANRVRFHERVSRALAPHGPWRQAPSVAVLFIDLDDFKDVNDRLGHQVGDQLLVAVADRLRRSIRSSDVPARLGGDEFAVLVTEACGPQELMAIAERILDALRAPVVLAGQCLVSPQGTIGVAIAETPQLGADELLRRADVAMYAAKARGKGATGLYEPSLEIAVQLRAAALAN
jgi:diguanylate cyclase (GGDEF)-like protein